MTSTVDRPAVTNLSDLSDLSGPTGLPNPASRAVVRRLPDIEPWVRPPASLNPPGARLPAVPLPETSTPPDNTVRAHAHLVLRLVMEVLDGRRPAAQLVGVLSEPARRYVTAASGRLDEPHQRLGRDLRRRAAIRHYPGSQSTRAVAGLRSMRVCQPAAGVAEISAVWRYRGRSRALAARFERCATEQPGPIGQTRWWCTELRLG